MFRADNGLGDGVRFPRHARHGAPLGEHLDDDVSEFGLRDRASARPRPSDMVSRALVLDTLDDAPAVKPAGGSADMETCLSRGTPK